MWAALGWLFAFVLLTWPLATSPLSAVVSHWDADIEHSLWAPWWFVHALTTPDTALFASDVLSHPRVANLQLADLNLAVLAVAGPLARAIGPAGAYNALLLASFLASAALCARLSRRLGAEPVFAWLAGLAFAASPYWLCCVLNGWGYLVHVWVFPLTFLALERARAEPRPGRSAGVALCLVLAFHVTPYYFLYLALLVALFLAPDALRWRPAGRGRALAAHGLAVVLPLLLGIAPRALPMWSAAGEPLVAHHPALNTQLAAALSELWLPSRTAVAARVPRLGYGVVFVGYVLPLVVLLGAWLGSLRTPCARYAGLALASLLLALGPDLKLVDGAPLGVPLPARWLQQLPGFSLTTNHWRWILPVGFCLAALFGPAATGLARSLRTHRPALAPFAAAGLLAALALERVCLVPLPSALPLWRVRVSPIAQLLRDHPEVHGVVDRTRAPKLNQTRHEKPLALAWLPRWPADVHAERARLAEACRDLAPECLARHAIDAVVLDDRRALLVVERDGRAVGSLLRVAPGGAER